MELSRRESGASSVGAEPAGHGRGWVVTFAAAGTGLVMPYPNGLITDLSGSSSASDAIVVGFRAAGVVLSQVGRRRGLTQCAAATRRQLSVELE